MTSISAIASSATVVLLPRIARTADGMRQGADGEVVAGQLRHHLPATEREDAGADIDEFFNIGRDDDVGGASLAVGLHHAVDFGLGADVDADGGVFKHDHAVFLAGPAGEHDLLLVAARERADVALRVGGLDGAAGEDTAGVAGLVAEVTW